MLTPYFHYAVAQTGGFSSNHLYEREGKEPFTWWRFDMYRGAKPVRITGEVLIHTLDVEGAIQEAWAAFNPRQRELVETVYLLTVGRTPEKSKKIIVLVNFHKDKLTIQNLSWEDACEMGDHLFTELGIYSKPFEGSEGRYGARLEIGINRHYGTNLWLPCMSACRSGFNAEDAAAFAGQFRLHQAHPDWLNRITYNPGIIGTGEGDVSHG